MLGKGSILIIIIGISLFINIPHVAAAGHTYEIDYATYSEKPAIPQNCSTSSHLLRCCIPDNAVNDVILPSIPSTPNKDVLLNLSPASLTGDIIPNIFRIPKHAPTPEILLSHPSAEYHCRDGLNSDDVALV